MFTDIEGYTALMQHDEDKAVEFRNRHRQVFNSLTEKYKGKILQYFGDGTLSTFTSVVDAVRCAIELQLAFQTHPQIPVRIGIHSGDILFTEDDIIGDGVNVASRIESLSVSGSIFVSDKVYDEIKNQPGIKTLSMGLFEFKNVNKPMEVFAITNPGLIIPDKDKLSGKLKSDSSSKSKETGSGRKWTGIASLIIVIAAVAVGYIIFYSNPFGADKQSGSGIDRVDPKKSIAVLPFINDSQDSSNVYIINGLMESILNNLQKIENIRVISRTSIEKYRNNPKIISEIAEELQVNYFIEGSGQKLGDKIMLHIQLIEAPSDKHLWAEQYNRENKDIFLLQQEVAKNIVENIEVIITPEEEERINKIPTENLEAYDYFLQGLDLLNKPTHQNCEKAIPFFEKAIELDPEFARAYAATAIAYYSMDEYQDEKKYTNQINHYADKALLYDPQLAQSLIAKALYYMHIKDYKLAIEYFEKTLKVHPNDDLVFVFLVNLYANHHPNTEKYLEYALKGLKVDFNAHDPMTASFSYLHISNAFIQSGFVDEAAKYIDKSLSYMPDNLYSAYVKAYISFAQNNDLEVLNKELLEALQKDTTRLDIMQEVAKSYYFLRDYENAYVHYKKYSELKELYNMDIYRSENAKIGVVCSQTGHKNESEKFFKEYLAYAENDESIYKHLSLAAYYSYHGEEQMAIDHLKLFSEHENYHYWIILFLDIDPLMENIREHSEFKKIRKKLEDKFWDYHQQVRSSLEEEGLI